MNTLLWALQIILAIKLLTVTFLQPRPAPWVTLILFALAACVTYGREFISPL